jgi:hypothetical protein
MIAIQDAQLVSAKNSDVFVSAKMTLESIYLCHEQDKSTIDLIDLMRNNLMHD